MLVVGQRYGSLSSDGISYTEKEYEFAQEIGLPILAFIQDRNTPTTPSERESDPYLQSKLNEFIARVMKGKICDFWINEDDLARRVSISLMKEFVNNPGIGWVRADSVNYGKKPKDTRIQPNIDSFLYEKKLSGLKDLTIKNYELQLNIFSSYFKDKMLSEINTKEIVNFLAYREKAYNINAKTSLDAIRVILKLFFEWLKDQRIIESNPVDSIKPLGKEEAKLVVLEKSEIEEIRNACVLPRERALVELILSTGCRLSEISAMKLGDLNWNQEIINVNSSRYGSRIVMLQNDAKKYLSEYVKSRSDESNYLFITERKPYRPLSNRGIQREISVILARTSINKGVSLSTFRNTFIKNMMENGVPANVVKSLLGHKLYSSTSNTFFKLDIPFTKGG